LEAARHDVPTATDLDTAVESIGRCMCSGNTGSKRKFLRAAIAQLELGLDLSVKLCLGAPTSGTLEEARTLVREETPLVELGGGIEPPSLTTLRVVPPKPK
jgi:hypothetical protein